MGRPSEVGGGYGAERSPPPGIQAQRPAPAQRTHRTHDRSMARWISVARAKVGGHGSSLSHSRKVAPSSGCPFVHFEQGNITFF